MLFQALTNRGYSSRIEFSSVVNRTEFVDKTLLIKSVIDYKSKQIIITTPHRCGKTTNIAMLKMFFEIQVEEGEPVTKSKSIKTPVNDTSNYKFFVGNGLKITRDKKMMKYHFGKFPVLHVDFKCEYKIKDSENSVICFRDVIHEAFFQHRHLRQSEKLTTKERRYVKKWCDNYGAYEEFFGQDVTNSLYKLCLLLYKHFDEREVVVLIDNFDFPTTSAMAGLKDAEEYGRVLKFNMGIISKLLSADYRYLKKAIVVGMSYVATAGIYSFEDAQCFRFLENHDFVSYFSLTKPEIDHLFGNPLLNLDQNSVLAAHDFYGGFLSLSGLTVYNFHSVLKFLQFRKTESYCLQSRIVRNLGNLLKINFIRANIEILVKGDNLVLPMYENVTTYDIMYLSKAISNQKFDDHFNVNLLFYLMFEQGYLTYVRPESSFCNQNRTEVKLPNRETRTRVSLKLKDYYDKFYVIDKPNLRKCLSFFNNMSPAVTVNLSRYKTGLYWFYKSFEELIRLASQRLRKLSLEDVSKIVFSLVFEAAFKDNSEFYIDFKERNGVMDYVLVRGKFAFYVTFVKNCSSSVVLSTMVEKGHLDQSNKQPKDVKRIVYVGLAVDEDLRPSVSCLANSLNISDAVHIP